MVGFAKVYTMLPVFSLVLGRSVPGQIVITYPELNKALILIDLDGTTTSSVCVWSPRMGSVAW